MNNTFKRSLGASALTFLILLTSGASVAKEAKGDPYLLGTCPMSGKALSELENVAVYEHEGREIRFCGPGCVEAFEKDPEKHLEAIDAAIVKQQVPLYPLDTCLVSGGKLGGMGAIVEHVYKNRLVRFCCKGCIGKFESDAEAYLKKLDAAVIEKQEADYPLTTCPVTGGAIKEGSAIDYVAGNRLVRFCCAGCIDTFERDPGKYLSKIDAARK